MRRLVFSLTILALALSATAHAEKARTQLHHNKNVNWSKVKIDRISILPVASTFGLDPSTLFDIQETVNEMLQGRKIFTLPIHPEEIADRLDPLSFDALNPLVDQFQRECATGTAPYALQIIVHTYDTKGSTLGLTKGRSTVDLDLAVCQKGAQSLLYRANIMRERDKNATLKLDAGKKSRLEALVIALDAALNGLLEKTKGK